jgi:N-dimethylarginine dimethylaminohydrolase
MINVWDEFTQLKEVVLGNVDPALVDHLDIEEAQLVREVFYQTQEDLNTIEQVYTECGILVHRPDITSNTSQLVNTPTFSTPGVRNPLSPRDPFIVLGNTILETACCKPEAHFEYVYYKQLFTQKWDQYECGWQRMPQPLHTQDIELDVEPILDAAQICRLGDTLVVSTTGAANASGVRWLQQHFDYNIILANPPVTGHIDAQLKILRPGLLISPHPLEHLPDCFSNWTRLDALEENIEYPTTGMMFRDDDVANTYPSTGIISLNEKTVFLYEHYKNTHNYYIKQLEKNGIDVVFVPFRHSHWFSQCLTCITLELHRVGTNENYLS